MKFSTKSNCQAAIHWWRGLRYLTIFSQGIVPINNNELINTLQGLTSDQRNYVIAAIPETHPNLPLNGNVSWNEQPEFTSDFTYYPANTVASLDTQAAESFTPNLIKLDAMMRSLEIRLADLYKLAGRYKPPGLFYFLVDKTAV